MLTNAPRWSHAPGNQVVPSRWQATTPKWPPSDDSSTSSSRCAQARVVGISPHNAGTEFQTFPNAPRTRFHWPDAVFRPSNCAFGHSSTGTEETRTPDLLDAIVFGMSARQETAALVATSRPGCCTSAQYPSLRTVAWGHRQGALEIGISMPLPSRIITSISVSSDCNCRARRCPLSTHWFSSSADHLRGCSAG
jgi:hypothetical protein